MALVQLVSKGIQDTHFTSVDGVSPFRTLYERHTNFSQAPRRLNIVGNIQPGYTSTIEIPSIGDLVNSLWLEGTDLNQRLRGTVFSLYIGGQLIDSQSWEYINDVWQPYMANSWTKATCINNSAAHADSNFQPLHFFFCEHDQFLPVCALAYMTIELKITWGDNIGTGTIKPYANYIYLDKMERENMIHTPHFIPITQVQSIHNSVDLSEFNHPIKAFFFGRPMDGLTGPQYTFNSASLYLNNNMLLEDMSPTFFHTIQMYYRSSYGVLNFIEDDGSGNIVNSPLYTNFFMYSFATNVTEYVSKGSCNMSRLDSAILKVDGQQPTIIYAVNYNVYRITDGLGGLMYSN